VAYVRRPRGYAPAMSQSESAWPATRTVGRVAAVLLACLALADILTTSPGPAAGVEREGDAIAVVLALLVTLPLVVIDRFPRGVALLSYGAVVLSAALGYTVAVTSLVVLVAVGVGVAETSRRDGIMLTILGQLVLVALAYITPGGVHWLFLTVNALIVGMAAALGAVIRGHRELAKTLAERAEELDALREARAREAVAQERLRIARDVHDVVGHALAAMTLHVRLAQRSLERDPAACAQSLAEIAELSSGALAQTRTAVGEIRAVDDTAVLRQPTLSDLGELVDRLRAPDLEIVLDERWEGPAPAGVETAAFRIVQESLSNVLRHARPARVRILVDRGDGELRVEVHDDGRGTNGPWQAGNGLRGMRERAESLGGAVEAGPAPDGGWRVVASLPTHVGSL
jgi:signal transduction histidine kinase